MKTPVKILVVGALAVAVAAAVVLKRNQGGQPVETNHAPVALAEPVATVRLPKLLDLGAGKCIPCKLMAPILDKLKLEYAGRMNVEFIDVWVNPDAAKPYGIEVIPTQIFYDADGKELFRHVGFFSREDILGKWKELGVTLGETPVGVQ
jgi:thioredoxin 1